MSNETQPAQVEQRHRENAESYMISDISAIPIRKWDAAVERLAQGFANIERDALAAVQKELSEARRALTFAEQTHEECHELLDECRFAFAGLNGELLDPCGDPTVCAGHFSKRVQAIYNEGLERYRAIARAAQGGEERKP